MVITYIRGLITPLRTTHEPPCIFQTAPSRFAEGVNAVLLERHQLTAGTICPQAKGISGFRVFRALGV